MGTYSFNLRGIEIYPSVKDEVHYYLCVIDAPDGVQQSDFTVTSNDTGGDLNFSYSGEFKNWGAATQTVCLPLHTTKPLNRTPQNVIITDSTNDITMGNPNTGIPPRVPLNTNPQSDYIPSSVTFTSATPGFESNAFVVVLVSTNAIDQSKSVHQGGYLNYFSGSQTNDTGDGPVVQFLMKRDSNFTNIVAIGGVAPCSVGYYQYAQAVDETGVGHASYIINWSGQDLDGNPVPIPI